MKKPEKHRVGYARVSSEDQNLDLQRDALKKAGCAVIYQESASGKSTAGRPELEQCLKALRAGDTLVVWRLDRLGRSLTDLIRTVNELQDGGIAFESISEQIDTSTVSGKLVFHVFAALSEFERNLIRERTRAGLAAARARGRNGGRPPAVNDRQKRQIRTLMSDPSSVASDVAKRYKIGRTTLYKIIKEAPSTVAPPPT